MEALRSSLMASDFMEGFIESTSMVLVSEIGDKTFFIAAIMAMRNPQLTVSGGARIGPRCLAHGSVLSPPAPPRRCLRERWVRCGL